MSKDHIIYLITNTLNGKVYVGKTSKTVEKRFGQHVSNAMKRIGNTLLYNSIFSHGADVFTAVEIGRAPKDTINALERYYIALYDANNITHGYNMTEGGDGGSTGHRPCSAETKAKIGAAHKGKKLSPEHRAKLSEAHKGPRPERAGSNCYMFGVKANPETTAKQLATKTERGIIGGHRKPQKRKPLKGPHDYSLDVFTPEHRERLSQQAIKQQQEHPANEEARLKMKVASLKYWDAIRLTNADLSNKARTKQESVEADAKQVEANSEVSAA